MKKLVLLIVLATVMATATGVFAAELPPTSWDVYFSGDVKILNTAGAVTLTKSFKTSSDTSVDVKIPTLSQNEKLIVRGVWVMEASDGSKGQITDSVATWTDVDFEKGGPGGIKFLGSSDLSANKAVVRSGALSFDLLAASECSVDIELKYLNSQDITWNSATVSSRDVKVNKELELDLAVAKVDNKSSGCNTGFAPFVLALFAPLLIIRRK